MANNFVKAGSLGDTTGAPILRTAVIANSVVAVQENSYKITSGFANLGTTGALVFGHADSIQTTNGIGEITTGVAGAGIGTFLGSWTALSTNQTATGVSQAVVNCDISKHSLYSATLNATINTTTGSGLMGYFINLADATQLSESSTLTTTLQYALWGADPVRGGNNVICNIYQSQVFGV
jgi:hypothetical protein